MMENTQAGGSVPLVTLLDMARRTRHVGDRVELDFLAVNGSHALAPYRQAALWFEDRKVCALSGVVQIEANAPYVQWLERLCAKAPPGALTALDFDGEIAQQWAEWLPAYVLWLPLAAGEGKNAMPRGGLLLARDMPWQEHEIGLLTEWCDVLRHAYAAIAKPAPWSPFALRSGWRRRMAHEKSAKLPWWRRRKVQVALGVLVLLCIPVRLTILAPGELVPANPAAIRSPLEGVIERFHVKPNQLVRKGDPLLDFDEAQLDSRYQVAIQALSTAEAEYRQSLQLALNDGKSKALLSGLQGKIEERRAESEYLRGQAERAHIVAPRDGIALFDDPSEWIGRPVMTGERIMRIATPRDVEIEAWLGIGDAIPLDAGAPVSLYLGASPLQPITASVRYVSYEALPRPDGSYAYRVRATLDGATEHRVGLKGTAKLTGHWVPAAYWIMRRPLAAIRQMLGV
ncbi:efflux RND transporter periplasmic adaptor subunit [Janthinobacterium aquaticum]|uniref:efflux RND transporter periplasmic adaptor subunit n=1 Tax=Janthinobacterium sp. FT58W TaxID=2654254 RepID=UPI0012641A60|nr:HlyD family efflux transporter periplasmic adaptor subunit [Janthinobacterium sp. FT58W]KAB8043228.1 HlyD family efflux transporter periplasmic adaptor subunit [Janthinobacterium sp. FT58W]